MRNDDAAALYTYKIADIIFAVFPTTIGVVFEGGGVSPGGTRPPPRFFHTTVAVFLSITVILTQNFGRLRHRNLCLPYLPRG